MEDGEDYSSNESGSFGEKDFDLNDPEKYGYQKLNSYCMSEDSSDNDGDREYYPSANTTCDGNKLVFHHEHDEEIEAAQSLESSLSSTDLGGKIESCSRELYSAPTASILPLKQSSYTEYDESYSVQSTPDTSPRDNATQSYTGSTISSTNVYRSSNKPVSQVDSKIGFFQSGNRASSKSPLQSSPYQSKYGSFDEDGRYKSQDTVRGMKVPSLYDHVMVEMEPISKDKLVPGRSLCKPTSSSLTKDGDEILTGLDKGSGSSWHSVGSYNRPSLNNQSAYPPPLNSNTNMPGYDDREYGYRDSLEHQHPDRQAGRQASRQANKQTSTNTSPLIIDSVKSYDACSSSATPLSNTEKRRGKRNKKVNKMPETLAKDIEGNVGNKDIDELLAYLGEENTSPDKSKKKKDKKMKKRDHSNSEKASKTAGTSNLILGKKKESQSSKTKQSGVQQDHVETRVPTSSAALSSIIQTTSDDGVTSRIILNGNFEERNIDEEIVKTLNKQSVKDFPQNSQSERVEPAISRVNGDAEELSPIEPEFKTVNQTIDVTYDIELISDFVEEEFIRVETPEPVEEEFRVVHKKKKGHHSKPSTVTAADKDINAIPLVPDHQFKPVNRKTHILNHKTKPEKSSKESNSTNFQRFSPSVSGENAVNAKPISTNSSTQPDLSSESAFPRLSSEYSPRAPKVATVQPFSWTDKFRAPSDSAYSSSVCNVGNLESGASTIQPVSFSHHLPESSAGQKTSNLDDSQLNLGNNSNLSRAKDELKSDYSGSLTQEEHQLNDICANSLSNSTEKGSLIIEDNFLEVRNISQEFGNSSPENDKSLLSSDEDNLQSCDKLTCGGDKKLNGSGARKSKVVEFVGRSAAKLEFNFGIDDEILSRTSLGQPNKCETLAFECGSGDHKVKFQPVDVLQNLLQAADSAKDVNCGLTDENRPLLKHVKMIWKEWKAAESDLKLAQSKEAGAAGRPRVAYWTRDLVI
ncbi:hypothetical protein EB796_023174 [Bugula neritina]|uniref:Uncharacterized protein n=1 Tax=Bugula neritina TaxID=10212 RepID=A0A7J7IX57_BUGNE|nr:hypothetical protein EB796_023174 [Bugula neritina]